MRDDGRNFWEIPVPPDVLDSWALDDELVEARDDAGREARERARTQVFAVLREIVATRLTERQRRIVELYFYEDRTQEQVAAELGISQQAVSRQLFGVLRTHRKVGGAIRKLRKICDDLGLDPGRWV